MQPPLFLSDVGQGELLDHRRPDGIQYPTNTWLAIVLSIRVCKKLWMFKDRDPAHYARKLQSSGVASSRLRPRQPVESRNTQMNRTKAYVHEL